MKNFNLNCFDPVSPEKVTELGSQEIFLFQETPYYLLEKCYTCFFFSMGNSSIQ